MAIVIDEDHDEEDAKKAELQAMLQADTVPLLCKLLYSPHPSAQLQAVF